MKISRANIFYVRCLQKCKKKLFEDIDVKQRRLMENRPNFIFSDDSTSSEMEGIDIMEDAHNEEGNKNINMI